MSSSSVLKLDTIANNTTELLLQLNAFPSVLITKSKQLMFYIMTEIVLAQKLVNPPARTIQLPHSVSILPAFSDRQSNYFDKIMLVRLQCYCGHLIQTFF